MNKFIIWTVGYQGITALRLAETLDRLGIEKLFDVRSIPYSKYSPAFNRTELEKYLENHWRIKYHYAGDYLGGKPKNQAVYFNGVPQYDLIAQTQTYQVGIKAIYKYASEYRIALMCMERDPATCHRARLLGQTLSEDFAVKHIHFNHSSFVIEDHEPVIQRALSMHKQVLTINNPF